MQFSLPHLICWVQTASGNLAAASAFWEGPGVVFSIIWAVPTGIEVRGILSHLNSYVIRRRLVMQVQRMVSWVPVGGQSLPLPPVLSPHAWAKHCTGCHTGGSRRKKEGQNGGTTLMDLWTKTSLKKSLEFIIGNPFKKRAQGKTMRMTMTMMVADI